MKRKYSVDEKIKACEDYLNGVKSPSQIAHELNMGKSGPSEISKWSKLYKANGEDVFKKDKTRFYPVSFKEIVINEYLAGDISYIDLAAKYGIPDTKIIRQWVKKYNEYEILKDYCPNPEIYMAKALKVSKEEKLKIIKHCIDNNYNFKETVETFGGNYAQIYNWVKNYEENGEECLIDNRGKRKAKEELSDLEKANRKIKQLERENKLKEIELELLKKEEALEKVNLASLPRAKQRYLNKKYRIEDYKIIKSLHEEKKWEIEYMCQKLGIKRSSYYKWLKSSPSLKMINKQKEDEEIVKKIKEIADSNNSLFGTMTMYYTLRNEGYSCGHNRVYRLMCINNIESTYRRESKYHYIKSTPEQVGENTLKRKFNADKPNEKWCTDVTEIKVPKTGEKLFISPMLDLYDRYPVALEISDRNDASLANKTLDNAHNLYPDATPLVHSDRGFAYTRAVYKNKLDEYGMSQSMSRVSRCIDNGVCEGFQGQFKDILFILYPNIETKEEMIEAIHGTLDYYINHYPQKRLGGKTCGQVRDEAISALSTDSQVINYPIKQSNKYIKFWADIAAKQQRLLERVAQ